jgi:hypothetical protein
MKSSSAKSKSTVAELEAPNVSAAPSITGGAVLAGPTPEAAASGGAAKFQDNGGPVIQIARLQLVYWGSAWASNPTPSANQVTTAVRSILGGSYMTGLAQYRQIGRGYLLGSAVISNSNPPNPFTDNDVANFLNARINDGTLPPRDQFGQNLYLFVMPKGVNNQNSGFVGEHTYTTDKNGNRLHFGWITNNGSPDSVTSIFSHELVESCTDPEGSAITGVAGTCSQGGWCEIGDICYVNAVVDGVTVQKYYSNADSGCIAPTWPSQTFPIKGVQWTGVVPANQTVTWFTYNWPEYYFVIWEVVPLTPGNRAQVTWQTKVERPSGAYITYWISVTNLTNQNVQIQGRYCIVS